MALAAFAAAAALSAWHNRTVMLGLVPPGELTGWDVLLGSFADHYFLAIPVVPAFLVACAVTMRVPTAPESVVRYGSRTRCALVVGTERAVAAAPFVLVWLAVDVAVAAPLGLGEGWSTYVQSGQAYDLVSGYMVGHLAPWGAVLAQLVLVLSGAWATVVALALVAVWTTGYRTLRWASAVLGLWILLSHRVPWDIPGALQSMTYLTVQFAMEYTGQVWWPVAGSVLVGVALLASSRLAEARRVTGWRIGPLTVYATIGVAVLWGTELLRAPFSADGGGLIAVFFGVGTGRFDVVPVVLHLVLTAGPAVALQVRLVDRMHHGLYSELVRCRSVTHWWWRVHLRPAAVVCVAVAVAALGMHLIAIGVLHGGDAVVAESGSTMLYFLLATAAEAFVLVLLLSATMLVTGSSTAVVGVLGVVIAATLPFIFRLGVLPVGMSSLSLVWEGVSPLRPAVVLVVWAVGAVVVTAWSVRARGLQIL